MKKVIKNVVRLSLIIGLTGFYLSFVSKVVSFYLADMWNYSAKESFEMGDFVTAHSQSGDAVDLNPNEPAYFLDLAKTGLAFLPKEETLFYLNHSRQLNPRNLLTLRNGIPLYYYLGIQDLSVSVKDAKFDSRYLSIASNYYADLKKIYPNDVGLLVSVAYYEKKLDLNEAHKETLKMIKDLRPDLVEWHPLLR